MDTACWPAQARKATAFTNEATGKERSPAYVVST
jgi:hypothetical protein